MEVQTEFLWDEKNSIEQPMNYENKNEQETNDTTNDTKTSSTQVDWRDITDPKLRRKMYLKFYNKIYNKTYSKDYYKLNKDKLKKYKKAYYEANKDKIQKQQQIYRRNNKNKAKEYNKLYYRGVNKDKSKKYNKAYYEANKNEIKQKQKACYEANKEKRKKQKKVYYEANKEKIINAKRIRRKTNIQFKLSINIRGRLNQALKNNYKCGSAVKDLGCTIDELKTYLESKFQEGMSWDNWTKDGWHIDHIRPLSSFDLTNQEEFLQACHYTNLQPLWAQDNLSKGDKIV